MTGSSSYSSALGMWMAMTAAMMTPVAVPWVRTVGRAEARRSGRSAVAAVAPFALGYAVAWAGFAALAGGGQRLLAESGLRVPFAREAPALAAGVVVLAGAFQFTALKRACLAHCRSPAGYLLTHWRSGRLGLTRLGVSHGLYCIGCCWALMALAFVVGMANVLWMGLMALLMFAETALPGGARLTKPAGVLLVLVGATMAIWAVSASNA